jgi:hypothetical protein
MILGSRARPEHKSDNLTAICKPTVLSISKPYMGRALLYLPRYILIITRHFTDSVAIGMHRLQVPFKGIIGLCFVQIEVVCSCFSPRMYLRLGTILLMGLVSTGSVV